MRDAAYTLRPRSPRLVPRISISKLGEYMGASPSRRRAIIRDQREPPEVKTLHCRQARTVVVSYLLNPEHDADNIHRTIASLRRQAPATEWQKREIASNTTALLCALKLPLAEFEGLKAERPQTGRNAISIGGVKVVVRPDLILRHQDGRVVGAAKLYFVKRIPLSAEGGAFVTTAIQRFMELGDQTESQRDRCLFIDVFAGKVHRAPVAFKKRMKDLEAACEEIAGRWPNA